MFMSDSTRMVELFMLRMIEYLMLCNSDWISYTQWDIEKKDWHIEEKKLNKLISIKIIDYSAHETTQKMISSHLLAL